MANPSFNEKLLNRIDGIESTDSMTIEGTINKSGILLLLTIAGAMVGWGSQSFGLAMILLLVNLGLAFAINFGPHRAQYLSQVYALSEGFVLGAISAIYNLKYPGVVGNALILTLSVLAIMLGLYRFQIIRVTEKLKSVIVAATMAIAVTYLVSMVMGFFGSGIAMIHEASPAGIGFSLVVVLVAAFNLLLDFDMIETLNARKSPKFMEWYSGFALLVTIVWLYIEILRLLSKLNRK